MADTVCTSMGGPDFRRHLGSLVGDSRAFGLWAGEVRPELVMEERVCEEVQGGLMEGASVISIVVGVVEVMEVVY